MKVDVLLGLQWGDEGKGKVVDVLTPGYDVIARFQGGPNAGHTLEFNNIKHVLHTIPSGIFRENKINIIGNGVVIDPVIFRKEIESLASKGFELSHSLYISKKAHLILPTHRMLDAASEKDKGIAKIGSTLKGIGPAYRDKIGREGIRAGDIFSGFEEKYNAVVTNHKNILEKLYHFPCGKELEECEKEWFESLEILKQFKIVDSEYFINNLLSHGKSVLAEGAQGTLLDVDFGSYPFVTSSSTSCGGVCTGLGVAPGSIGRVLGIFKAYCTRVGSGPFPTEQINETGDMLRKAGNEYGSTTGRPRRCGWLDLVALKYSIMLNGVTEMCMMKADVLDQCDTIKICTGYETDGEITEAFPFEIDDRIQPVFVDLPGWHSSLKGITKPEDFPRELSGYIRFIEENTGIPVTMVSVGPQRDQTIRIIQSGTE